jgi:hypothetical protein
MNICYCLLLEIGENSEDRRMGMLNYSQTVLSQPENSGEVKLY